MMWEWLLPINCILVYLAARMFLDRNLSLSAMVCLVTFGILASTEILSVFHAISRRSLMLFWGGLDALLVLILLLLVLRLARRGELHLWNALRDRGRQIREHKAASLLSLVLLAMMAVIGATAIRLAWQTAPYNWDSMTYHLGRVAHWYQNGSVAHYASNIDRQILSPPLGEFMVLQVYTLAGGMDRSVNLVQCAAYILSAVLVARLGRQLGARRWMAYIASILFMTMPIAFAESLTTQVDLISCVYLLIFVITSMSLWQQESSIILRPQLHDLERTTRDHNLLRILSMGLCIGYGYLCKPSVCLGMVIFLLPVLMSCKRRKDSMSVVLCSVVIAAVIAALVAVPELLRMYGTYHAFSDPQAGARRMVGSLDPRFLLLNFLKNIAFNLPNSWMSGLSDGIIASLTMLAAIFGVDLNDPAISEDGRDYVINSFNDYDHDTAVNAGIWWLWLICLALLLVTLLVQLARRRRDSDAMRMATVYIRTTVLTCVLFWFVVRWEKYEVRYMVPYLALICVAAPIAIRLILSRLLPDRWVRGAVTALLLLILIPTFLTMRDVVDHHTRLAQEQGERQRGYYQWLMSERAPQEELCAAVIEADYASVGISCSGDYYEYPLFTMLGPDITVEHILVDNKTARYEDASFVPDCILLLGRGLPEEYDRQGYLLYHGERYKVRTAYDDGHLLLVKE